MMRLAMILGWLLWLILLVGGVHVQASTLDWKAYETDHFIVYFPDGYQYQAQETAYYLEKLLPRVQRITGNERTQKLRIIVQDTGINSNGYADMPLGKMGIYTNAPPSGGSLSAYENWFRLVAGHETTHMYQMSNYTGAGAVLPTLFGNVASGNLAVPGWIIEGIAVYTESTISPFEGRLNDGYYDALIAAKAKAGKLPNILEAGYEHAADPGGQWYVYGGALIRYLAQTYGEEKLGQFFDAQGANLLGAFSAMTPSLGIDRAAKKVFGKPFPTLFAEWEAAETAEHQNWAIEGQAVRTGRERGRYADLAAYQGKLYYIYSRPLTPEPYTQTADTSLMEWNPVTGKERVLMKFSGKSEARMQIVNHRIYFTAAEMTGGFANIDGNGLGQTAILYSFDLTTGVKNRLVTDRIKAFGVMPDGDIVYATPRKGAYGSEIFRCTRQGIVRLGVTDQDIAELQWYQDGWIAVSKSDSGSWNIGRLDPVSLGITPYVNTPWAEFGIETEGDLLYYTANYDHVYAVYSYNLHTGEINRVSRGSFAMNSAVVGNELYFRGVTADGEAVFKTELLPVPCDPGEKEVTPPEDRKVFTARLKETGAVMKSYGNLLRPYNRIAPSLLAGEDGLGLNRYTVSYSPFSGMDLDVVTGELMPLRLGVSNRVVNTNGERETVLTAYYPLFTSSQYGLTSVSLSGSTNFSDETRGELSATIRQPRQTLRLTADGTPEGGTAAEASYIYTLDHGSLRAQASTFHNIGAAVQIRGLGYVGGKNVTGNALHWNLTHKLWEVRNGFWNTSVFLADLYGNLFLDHTSLDGGYSSVGAEVLLEMGVGFMAKITPKIGVAYIGEIGLRPVFGMNAEF